MAELNSPIDEKTPTEWALSVDITSNIKGSGAGITLEGYGDIIIEETLTFEFIAINNHAEYETLIALEMDASKSKAKTDSKLVANQVSSKHQVKEP